jgi:chromate transporter
MNASPNPKLARPTFAEAFWFWLKLGFISFGGPAGQIAIMHSELVEQKKWISEARFLHALNFCMLLPGPEAQQLSIYIGWLLHRTRGGLVAGILFVLPSALLLWALSLVYVLYGHLGWVSGIFYGLKPAVLAIVLSAVLRIGNKALKNEIMWTVAVLAFGALFFLHLPFPVVMIAAGLTGWWGGIWRRDKFVVLKGHGSAQESSVLDHDPDSDEPVKPTFARAARVLAIGLTLWWLPVLGLGCWLGWVHALFQQGVFFSKAAMVTFGGAYAVLPYVSQQAVEHYHWLQPGQMLDGLGLAETTPGPLIMVLQFVGFLGGWFHPGNLPPVLAATLGAAITTWTTFVPCFIWIFLGAPHLESLHGNERLSAALSCITAAVVGVILNLALWFGWHVLLADSGKVDLFALIVSVISFIGLVRWKWNVIALILISALAGMVLGLLV